MDSIYIEYFYALKIIWELHTQNGFGESPDIPSGYSESLCRSLYNFSETETRDNDAQSSTALVEIKATGTAEGKTTISNKAQFDMLYWLYFDFENDSLIVHKIQRDYFSLSGKKGRKSVRLSTIVNNNNIAKETFTFNIVTLP